MPRRASSEGDVLEPKVSHADEVGPADGYRQFRLRTERGPVEVRLYEAEGARSAALFVGGVGGGFDTPAGGLYPRLGEALAGEGHSALRVRFRRPTDLDEAVHDVLAGMWFLGTRGVERVGLVGHSFGGAVVISAAVASVKGTAPAVSAVVTLATQSHGTERVAELSPRPLLLVHGTDDEILPPVCSLSTYRQAHEPKEIRIFQGARHGLDEVTEPLRQLVHAWLVRQLGAPSAKETRP